MLIPIDDHEPQLAPGAWTAPTATLIGQVWMGEGASAWYGVVVRGDTTPIRIGARSNLQDNVVCHADPHAPLTVGEGVTVGHAAVLHGCTVEDGCLIGMSATVLNNAVVGAGSLVAAKALVTEGMVIPPGSLVAGVPAKVRRSLTEEEIAGLPGSAATYERLRDVHRQANGG
jgi:carbonic anhydrase/acetyltransferase-like protein (isoleucine patch superfamily)